MTRYEGPATPSSMAARSCRPRVPSRVTPQEKPGRGRLTRPGWVEQGCPSKPPFYQNRCRQFKKIPPRNAQNTTTDNTEHQRMAKPPRDKAALMLDAAPCAPRTIGRPGTPEQSGSRVRYKSDTGPTLRSAKTLHRTLVSEPSRLVLHAMKEGGAGLTPAPPDKRSKLSTNRRATGTHPPSRELRKSQRCQGRGCSGTPL